jgi:hypothetical protein
MTRGEALSMLGVMFGIEDTGIIVGFNVQLHIHQFNGICDILRFGNAPDWDQD